MKKKYVRPAMVGERFAADEYVAACGGELGIVYKFYCDAGSQGSLYQIRDENKNYIGKFSPCGAGKFHEVSADESTFVKVEVDKEGGGEWWEPAYMWVEDPATGTGRHCTKTMDMDKWERVKS